MVALAGNDLLEGGPGGDYLDGGEGIDTASYASSASDVWVILNNSTPERDGDAEGDYLTSIENLIGSAYEDSLSGDGLANRIQGGDGGDYISGGGGNDEVEGGKGEDLMAANEGDDKMVGGDGSDVMSAGAGKDELTGWQGCRRVLVQRRRQRGDERHPRPDQGLQAEPGRPALLPRRAVRRGLRVRWQGRVRRHPSGPLRAWRRQDDRGGQHRCRSRRRHDDRTHGQDQPELATSPSTAESGRSGASLVRAPARAASAARRGRRSSAGAGPRWPGSDSR